MCIYIYIYIYRYELKPSLWNKVHLEKSIVTQLTKISPTSMETEGSLSCSLKPGFGPYPEPDEFSPSLSLPF
jgi:hypothetical protein